MIKNLKYNINGRKYQSTKSRASIDAYWKQ